MMVNQNIFWGRSAASGGQKWCLVQTGYNEILMAQQRFPGRYRPCSRPVETRTTASCPAHGSAFVLLNAQRCPHTRAPPDTAPTQEKGFMSALTICESC
ncbi:hypothetical protein FKM82_023211 [Ascaphus truei]